MNNPDIIFPNLDIKFSKVNEVAITIFDIDIYWYGVIICTGIILGLVSANYVAKKTGQNKDIYSEMLIYCLILAVIGARLYYVVFAFDDYKNNLAEIFALREGGLAIYGGVIGAVLGCFLFSKVKKQKFLLLADTGVVGLIIGQAIGRWGNFVNKEAFGGYSDGIFAMAIKASEAKYIPESVLEKMVTINGADYIQVQPTFLYESLWCIIIFFVLVIYTKYKKFDGEIFLLYFILYGIGRFIIEGLRTDQLIIKSIGLPASQVFSVVMVVISFIIILLVRMNKRKERIRKQLGN